MLYNGILGGFFPGIQRVDEHKSSIVGADQTAFLWSDYTSYIDVSQFSFLKVRMVFFSYLFSKTIPSLFKWTILVIFCQQRYQKSKFCQLDNSASRRIRLPMDLTLLTKLKMTGMYLQITTNFISCLVTICLPAWSTAPFLAEHSYVPLCTGWTLFIVNKLPPSYLIYGKNILKLLHTLLYSAKVSTISAWNRNIRTLLWLKLRLLIVLGNILSPLDISPM